MGLDKWVAIATVTHMSLEDFLALDEFWQQAVFEAVNSFVKDQNKEQEKAINAMTSRIEEMRPHSSPFNGMNKPNFLMP